MWNTKVRLSLLLCVLLPAALFAGGGQEGAATTISFEDEARQYISPTGDEVQDVLQLSPIAVRGEGRAIRSYQLTVYGTSGGLDGQEVYRQFQAETRERGFFGSLFNVGEVPSLELPSELVWDGTYGVGDDRDGQVVPDGDYLYQLQVTDDLGRGFTTPPARVTVDTEPPQIVSVEPDFTLFSPTGDGMRDVLTITQEGSREYTWLGFFADQDGTPVREFEQINTSGRIVNDQEPPVIEWDGTDNAGEPVPNGVYFYTLVGIDRAGNRAESSGTEVELDREAQFMALEAEYEVFSPRDTGIRDELELYPHVFETEGLRSWRIDIRAAGEALIRRIDGDFPIPSEVVFDGRGSLARPASPGQETVPEGSYSAELIVIHSDGLEEVSEPVEFSVDLTPPRIAAEPQRRVFNPESDDADGELGFSQASSEEDAVWTGRILNSEDETIRTYEWEGIAEDFAWDGRNEEGEIASDGIYSYEVNATDPAGNTGGIEIIGLRLDTISAGAQVEFGPRAIRPQEVFEDDFADAADEAAETDESEQDGESEESAESAETDAGETSGDDDLPESVEVTLDIHDRDQIQSWMLEFQHVERNVAARVHGTGPVPDTVGWDGRLDDDRIIDGEYLVRFVLQYPENIEVTAAAADYLIVDTRGPELALDISPEEFSPDVDGEDTELTVAFSARDLWTDVEQWSIEVLDPQGNQFRYWEGSGSIEETVQWDGRNEEGELVLSAVEYLVLFESVDSLGNQSMQTRTISTDIMVFRDGDTLRINIPSIVFEPYAFDLFERENQTLLKNIRTLQRLSDIVKSYPDHTVRIGGHAVSLLYDDEDLARREQQETLLPLSSLRAREVRKALGILGVQLERMTARGYGGAEPVVPHSDLENRWKNRRVEVIMTPR